MSKLFFEFGPLRAVVAGGEAVTLFFVLSGFVLSLPFFNKHRLSYRSYVLRRFCRIYIPYITAILIALLFKEMFYSGKIDGLSDWFNTNWANPLDAKTLLVHVLLVGTFNSNLNSVVWSLVHEMRISLFFPFIIFILLRINFKKGIVLGLLMSTVSIVYSLVMDAPFWGTELYATVHYSGLFIMGALIAKYREEIKSRISNFSLRNKNMLFVSGIILYSFIIFMCSFAVWNYANVVYFLIAIVGTIAISSLLYLLIEKPAMKLGTFLSKMMNKRNENKNSAAVGSRLLKQ